MFLNANVLGSNNDQNACESSNVRQNPSLHIQSLKIPLIFLFIYLLFFYFIYLFIFFFIAATVHWAQGRRGIAPMLMHDGFASTIYVSKAFVILFILLLYLNSGIKRGE